MFFFKRKNKNRRVWHRADVLEVKVRSKVARAARLRLAAASVGLVIGTVIALYALWRAGQWTLDALVYENKSFAIQQIDMQTDGMISKEQLVRWSGARVGQNLLALDLAGVKHDLEMVPMIQSASVERILPGTLRVRVTEREPIAQAVVLRERKGGGFEQAVFQLDGEGYVVLPLDPSQRILPLGEPMDQLPVIDGVNASEFQPGRRIDLPQVQAAMRFITCFGQSPMSGLADLKRVDVSNPSVLIVTTGQGAEITFATDNFEKQIGRWQKIHDQCLRENKNIGTLDLAVDDYTPLKFLEASAASPGSVKPAKPPRPRKKNV